MTDIETTYAAGDWIVYRGKIMNALTHSFNFYSGVGVIAYVEGEVVGIVPVGRNIVFDFFIGDVKEKIEQTK